VGLANRLAEYKSYRTQCKTCTWYEELNPEDKEAFDSWLSDKRSVSGLFKLCQEEGLTATRSPFRDHVNNHHHKDKT